MSFLAISTVLLLLSRRAVGDEDKYSNYFINLKYTWTARLSLRVQCYVDLKSLVDLYDSTVKLEIATTKGDATFNTSCYWRIKTAIPPVVEMQPGCLSFSGSICDSGCVMPEVSTCQDEEICIELVSSDLFFIPPDVKCTFYGVGFRAWFLPANKEINGIWHGMSRASRFFRK